MQRKPDISLAKSNLGWETGVKLKEGLLETIGYFEELIRGCIWRLKTLTQWNEISISKDRAYRTTEQKLQKFHLDFIPQWQYFVLMSRCYRYNEWDEHYVLSDFDLGKSEVVRDSIKVVPKYGGKLKLLKTSVSLPQSIIDDLRRLARIKGMTSYQSLLRELVSEKVFEEKRRLQLF